jgi:hypothetical protein
MYHINDSIDVLTESIIDLEMEIDSLRNEINIINRRNYNIYYNPLFDYSISRRLRNYELNRIRNQYRRREPREPPIPRSYYHNTHIPRPPNFTNQEYTNNHPNRQRNNIFNTQPRNIIRPTNLTPPTEVPQNPVPNQNPQNNRQQRNVPDFIEISITEPSRNLSQNFFENLLGTNRVSLQTLRNKTTIKKFEGESEMCSICRGNMDEGDVVRTIGHCGHTFHINCIDRWLEDQKKCPICRHNLLESVPNQPAAAEAAAESETDEGQIE